MSTVHEGGTVTFATAGKGGGEPFKAYFIAMHEGAHGLAPVLAGRYHDECRRIDGTWWFHHRHMFPDLRGDLTSHLTRSIEEFNEPVGG